jgi:hypothetical protein
MSDDSREGQSKSDRAPVSAVRLPRPSSAVAPSSAGDAGLTPAPPAERPVPESEADWDARVAAGFDQDADWDDADDEDDEDYQHDEDDEDDEEEEEALPLTFVEKLRRVPPVAVILTAGSLGSIFFLARAATSHTTPVPVLLSAGVVAGLVFAVDAIVASVATWSASRDGRTRRALLLAGVGGFAALFSAASLAGVLLMVLVLNG